MTKIQVMIVDDEPLARARMKRLLSSIDAVEIVGIATNGMEAIVLSKSLKLDLIFMDIQMPKMTGIDAAKEIISTSSSEPPGIIFCTAYDQYAIQAFQVNATSYLLKPVNQVELKTAIQQASKLNHFQLSAIKEEAVGVISLPIKQGAVTERLLFSDIFYFRTEGKCIVAGLENQKEILVDYTLKELEERCAEHFIRVHRNTLVNKSKLLKLNRDDPKQDYVELTESGMTFSVSRRMLSLIKKCFV